MLKLCSPFNRRDAGEQRAAFFVGNAWRIGAEGNLLHRREGDAGDQRPCGLRRSGTTFECRFGVGFLHREWENRGGVGGGFVHGRSRRCLASRVWESRQRKKSRWATRCANQFHVGKRFSGDGGCSKIAVEGGGIGCGCTAIAGVQ